MASPMMSSAGAIVVDSFGSSIAVELGVMAGEHAGGQVCRHNLNFRIETHKFGR